MGKESMGPINYLCYKFTANSTYVRYSTSSTVFSLVDTRTWYVMADYRENELDRIAPGMEAEARTCSSLNGAAT